MHQRVLLSSSIVLLFFLFSFTYVAGQSLLAPQPPPPPPASSTTTTTTTQSTSTTTTQSTSTTTTQSTSTISTQSTISTTTKKNYNNPGYGGGSNNYNKGYNNYDDDDDYNGYGNKKYNKGYNGYDNDNGYEKGIDGIDPDKYGTDFADFGSVYEKKKPMLSQLDVWIYAADDWEQKGSESYNKIQKYKKSRKGKNYNNDDYKGGSKHKRSYSQVRFPAKQVRNFRQFPFGRMPPLISIMPWLPIFYDKLTYQTFIFSPTGGIYIIPPLINFYGQRFAVAQLIKWGYASLVSSGAPPPPNVDVAPLVRPAGGGPVVAGVVGSPGAGPGPSYDSRRNRFNDGVRTDFPNFKARYPQSIEEGGNRNSYGSSSGADSSYGGTRNQQLYPQGGGQRSGGGGYNN